MIGFTVNSYTQCVSNTSCLCCLHFQLHHYINLYFSWNVGLAVQCNDSIVKVKMSNAVWKENTRLNHKNNFRTFSEFCHPDVLWVFGIFNFLTEMLCCTGNGTKSLLNIVQVTAVVHHHVKNKTLKLWMLSKYDSKYTCLHKMIISEHFSHCVAAITQLSILDTPPLGSCKSVNHPERLQSRSAYSSNAIW